MTIMKASAAFCQVKVVPIVIRLIKINMIKNVCRVLKPKYCGVRNLHNSATLSYTS